MWVKDESAMAVSIQPDRTGVQRMPSEPSSMAIERVKACTAAFDVLYTGLCRTPDELREPGRQRGAELQPA